MPVGITQGTSPLILTFPYVGVDVPAQLLWRLSDAGRAMRDTDRYLDRVFNDTAEGATVIRANFCRYLSDVNAVRAEPYTKLGETMEYDSYGDRIWSNYPQGTELHNLHAAFFVPYHAAVFAQIARIRAKHGHAILCECVVARQEATEAQLQEFDVSVSTLMAVNCAPLLAAGLVTRLQSFAPLAAGIEKRADPGWTVRHYGKAKQQTHALQLRINSFSYLTSDGEDAVPDPDKLAVLAPALSDAMTYLSTWSPQDSASASGSYRS